MAVKEGLVKVIKLKDGTKYKCGTCNKTLALVYNRLFLNIPIYCCNEIRLQGML